MLYALACVLAFKQILLLDGVYPKLLRFKGTKNDLRRNLQQIDWMLDDSIFLHYHRLALAELSGAENFFESHDGHHR